MYNKINIEWGIYKARRKYYKTDGNFQTTMAELKKYQDDIKEIKTEINDFKASLQFTENKEFRKKKVKVFSERVKVYKVYDIQIDPELVHNKLVDIEDRSRRNNLRIYGVKEMSDETWEKCEEYVQQVFSVSV